MVSTPGFSFHELAKPKYFRRLSRPLVMVLAPLALVFWGWGLYSGLFNSPPDYQQKESVRIMYIHVPAAWLSLFIYTSMALAGLIYLVWRHILAALYIRASVGLGAAFTVICLVTGSIWGIPTWGTWWVWDARLTSMLILLFLYIGVVLILDSFDHQDQGLVAASWLSIIGSINIPIIKFSVEWWNTLHQGASISTFDKISNPSIDPSFLGPLIVMTLAYFCTFLVLTICRLEQELRMRKLIAASHSRGIV